VAFLEIGNERDGTTVCLTLRGELDISTAEDLEKRLQAVESNRVVLDLRELEFIDSSGVRVLVVTARRFDESGREFALIRGADRVDRVLRLTGIDGQIEVLDAE
jgi:anti-sigma B factor antagonist